tara:strand:- start:4754 stop:5089 length:336 start_codon:yes stop_codon:yes gene_type:complete
MPLQSIEEEYVNRQLTLVRGAEGEAREMSSVLDEFYDNIYAEIARKYPDDQIITKSIAKAINKFINEELKTFYKVYWPNALKELQPEVIQKEIIWNTTTIEAFAYGTEEDG